MFDHLVNQISVQIDEIAADQVDSHYQPSTPSLPFFPPLSSNIIVIFPPFLLTIVTPFFCKDFSPLKEIFLLIDVLLYNHNIK